MLGRGVTVCGCLYLHKKKDQRNFKKPQETISETLYTVKACLKRTQLITETFLYRKSFTVPEVWSPEDSYFESTCKKRNLPATEKIPIHYASVIGSFHRVRM